MNPKDFLAMAIAKPDATATKIPEAKRDADVKRKLARFLNAKAAGDSAKMVNRPRTGNVLDDFGAEWVEAGGRFKPRDDANEARSASDDATAKERRTVPPAMLRRRP